MRRAVQPRAVVFDLDGTLLDSLPLVLAAITHAIEPFGSRPTMEIFARLGGPPERFLATLVNDLKNVPVALERLETYHRENAHMIRPYEGVVRLLERLGQSGVRIALWTGRDRISASWLLRKHRMEDFFAAIMCGDDLPSHKPDPAGLLEVMRRLGVTAEETLFVGDADVDVLGGAACGVDTLLIRHDRQVEIHISTRTWQTVLSPEEAYGVILGLVENYS